MTVESRTDRRWLQVHKWKFAVLSLLVVAAGIALALWHSGLAFASWARYKRIESMIEADPQHLLGKSFDEVSKELGLEDVPWDECTLSGMRGCENRMYHFPGFYLHVTVEYRLSGSTPDSIRQQITANNMSGAHFTPPGVLWLAHQEPFVRIDGIRDSKERIERFFREANEEAQRSR